MTSPKRRRKGVEVKAWAARSPSGALLTMTVRRTRREVIEFIPLIGIGAGDYRRLGPHRSYEKMRRRGWRVERVVITTEDGRR